MKLFLKSKYVSSAAIYIVTSGLLALLPLLLLPVITSHISVSDFGIYITYLLACKIMCSVLSLGYIECLAREFSCNTPFGFSKYYVNALYNVSVWSAFVMCLASFIFLSVELNISIDFIYVPLLFAIAYSQFVIGSLLSIFQMGSNPVRFGVIKVLLFTLEYGSVIALILFKSISYQDLLNAYVFSHVVVAAISICILIDRKILVFGSGVKLFDKNLRYSLPLVPHELSGLVLSFSDRFMINHFMGTSAVAIYAIGYQFGQVVSLVDTAVNKAWVPWLYKELQKDNVQREKIIFLCLAYVAGLIFFSILVYYMASYIIVSFYSREYALSAEVVLYIAFAFVVFGIYKIFAGFLFFHRKTKILGLLTFGSVVVNILLSSHFIPAYGIIGAAYSTLISFIVLCSLVSCYFFTSMKRY
jgi:O-antigen/teichoic acid export membrane protein